MKGNILYTLEEFINKLRSSVVLKFNVSDLNSFVDFWKRNKQQSTAGLKDWETNYLEFVESKTQSL
jgi:hypothetical protein